ncbi:MAG: topoisomerase DNA-binding C4 zinc finger domain-containing protein [Deltaproteobacteria bacterium]|nr:topoisomerase DNA-binding C4 zinc finger domain-containing protein [Deltaproteobacteria bacterium]
MAETETQNIRTEFDSILKEHIQRLLDTMPDAASLPFDLATITSLILLVERENEIKTFNDSPPKRYSKETLLEDLADMGLELDDVSLTAVANLQPMGFIRIEPDGSFVPRQSTAVLVEILDHMFPDMPGLGLVAYILQTIDETLSGRKDLKQALNQFAQTLESRGVPFSVQKQKASQGAAVIREKYTAKKPVADRKQAYIKRLSEIRSRIASEPSKTPTILPIGTPEQPKVISLFTKSTPSDPADPQDEGKGDETQDGTADISLRPDRSETEPDRLECCDISESPKKTAVTEDRAIEKDVSAYQAERASPVENTVSVDAESEPNETKPVQELDEEDDILSEKVSDDVSCESEPEDRPDENLKAISQEKAIEEKIWKFQETLAMSCPVCSGGSVRVATTEKGKHYYVCVNEECSFISWGKPYHFRCPFCQNPFLVEFTTPNGDAGLKCPKATCNYHQSHLNNPQLQNHSPSVAEKTANNVNVHAHEFSAVPKKKRKRIVRRRLVRRKR